MYNWVVKCCCSRSICDVTTSYFSQKFRFPTTRLYLTLKNWNAYYTYVTFTCYFSQKLKVIAHMEKDVRPLHHRYKTLPEDRQSHRRRHHLVQMTLCAKVSGLICSCTRLQMHCNGGYIKSIVTFFWTDLFGCDLGGRGPKFYQWAS